MKQDPSFQNCNVDFQDGVCCGYSNVDQAATRGFDCVQIPGAAKEATATATVAAMLPSRFCGRSKGLATSLVFTNPMNNNEPVPLSVTVCCKS